MALCTIFLASPATTLKGSSARIGPNCKSPNPLQAVQGRTATSILRSQRNATSTQRAWTATQHQESAAPELFGVQPSWPVPHLPSPRDQSARQLWSESSPVQNPASGSATTTDLPTPRTVASSTCALRTGPSTRRRATNPWPLTSLPGRANQRRRCPDARTSTRKKNNCAFGRLDPSAAPWIIYNTNKYIF